MKKHTIKAIALSLTLVSGVCTVLPTIAATTGTERTWSCTLPHNYGNKYFALRDKETNETTGTVKATEIEGTDSINVWFNTGTTSSPIIITKITPITTENVSYDVMYQSNSTTGTDVFLGVENGEKTTLNNDTAAGTVNYK